MTELLYYKNPDMLVFSAKVTSVTPAEKDIAITLDRSAFYPEGGGQPADRGNINGIDVIDVGKKDGEIFHYLKPGENNDAKIPAAGEQVECIIDGDYRFDYMQQHTGQHIISAAMMKTAGIATVSVHQGEEYTAVETSAEELTHEQMLEIEAEANRSIRSDTEVEAIRTDLEGLSNYKLRRPTKHSTNIRIINIPGIDCVACGGLHLKRTSEVGLIKYICQEKIRGHIRTFWKIGNRAYRDYDEKTCIINSLNELYSARQFELAEKAQAAADSFNTLKYSYSQLEQAYAADYASILISEAEKTSGRGGRPHIIRVFENRDKGFITNMVKALSAREGAGASFIFNRTESALTWAAVVPAEIDFDYNVFRTEFLPLIDGKGGGKPPLWQGIAGNPDGLDRIIELLKKTWL